MKDSAAAASSVSARAVRTPMQLPARPVRAPEPRTQQHDLVCKAHRRHVVGTHVEVVSLNSRNQGCDHMLPRIPSHPKS